MKALLACLALVALLLGGCGKDPVVKDLEAFDKLGRATFQMEEMKGLQQKMQTATTMDQRKAVMEEMILVLESKSREMRLFQAKTPEVDKISKQLNEGLDASVEGAKQAREAMGSLNQNQMMDAITRMTNGQKTIIEAGKAYAELAKQKGLKIKE